MGIDADAFAGPSLASQHGNVFVLNDIWRPVQYLGSKLRSLEVIMGVATSLPSRGSLWDAFSGSTVVAQAAAVSGFSVYATDTQEFSRTFAQALLRIGAGLDEVEAINSLVPQMLRSPHPDEDLWHPWLVQEDAAIQRKDYAALAYLYAHLPQRWKPGWRMPTTRHTPLTTTYAGSYLSLRQAMALDAARLQIRRFRATGTLSEWQEASLITLLCHAASRAVHSAGKHFAQPIAQAKSGNANFGFVSRRALTDRSVSVHHEVTKSIPALLRPRGEARTHRAQKTDALTVQASDLPENGIVYADPPYTAQQYSRFYHLLEVLAAGRETRLQVVKGKTPRGIYPAERYMSPFCSKREAGHAFRHLIETAHKSHSHLLISYSPSSQESGNQRTISLSDLEELVSDSYGATKTRVMHFDHVFRQFNSVERRQNARETGEVLIVAEAT